MPPEEIDLLLQGGHPVAGFSDVHLEKIPDAAARIKTAA